MHLILSRNEEMAYKYQIPKSSIFTHIETMRHITVAKKHKTPVSLKPFVCSTMLPLQIREALLPVPATRAWIWSFPLYLLYITVESAESQK